MPVRRQHKNAYTPNENISVITSSRYKSGGMPVIWMHGAGGTMTQASEQPLVRRDLNQLARRGYVAACSDLGGPATWGNDTGLASVTAQLTWLGTAYAADTARAILIGDSHGAAVALNWAVRNPTKVAAMVLRVPVVALQAFHDRNPLGLAAGMETAYTNLAGLIAAYPTRDPSHPTMAALIVSLGLHLKTRLYYNTDDPYVLASEVLAYAALTGTEAVNLGGTGHSPWETVDAVAQHTWIRGRL